MLFSEVLVLIGLADLVSCRQPWQTTLRMNSGYPELIVCNNMISQSFVFDFTPLGLGPYPYYDGVCGYPPSTGSLMLCAASLLHNDTAMMNKIFHQAESICADYSSFNQTWEYFQDQYENATQYYVPLDQISNISRPIFSPSLPPRNATMMSNRAYQAFYQNMDWGTWFSVGICVYFALVFAVAAVFNFLKQTGLITKLSSPVINVVRSYVTIPAMLPNGKYMVPWGWEWFSSLMPNRIESVIIAGMSVTQIVFYCIPYHQKDAADLFDSEHYAYLRMISDRSGILAFGKAPLVVLFAGRNNFLCWLTGIKYSSFIQMHKYVARWLFLEAVVHSVGYTVLEIGYYTEDLHSLYFACGVAATVISGALWLFSFHVFRRHTYEIFLYFHIILAIAFIAMCWYHCRTLGYCEWLVAAGAVWFVDRLVRIARMARFGYRKADIQRIDNDVFRLVVPRPKSFHIKPGQYGYIYFADSLLWFQSHPFTMIELDDTIRVYIKAKKGITARIFNQLLETEKGHMTRRVCIEGPYGTHSTVAKHNNVLLLAGGSGVPGIVDHAIKLGHSDTKAHVKFVWIVRTLQSTETYMRDLLYRLRDTCVQVELYITSETESSSLLSKKRTPGTAEDSSSSEKRAAHQDSESLSSTRYSSIESIPPLTAENVNFITIHYKRPNIEEILHTELAEFGEGSTAVASCGPEGMQDALRAAVAREVLRSTSRLDFFDELQKW